MKRGKKTAKKLAAKRADVPQPRMSGEKGNHLMHVPGSQNRKK